MRRLLSSTIARLVVAIFFVQVLSGAAAIYLLRTQMLQVVHDERARQVVEVRDDLLQAFYDGGRERVEEEVESQRGASADPLVFVSLDGNGPGVLSNLVAVPNVPTDGQVHRVLVHHVADAAATEGLAIGMVMSDGSRLVVGASALPDRSFNLAFVTALGLTVGLTGLLALLAALIVGYAISRRTHAIADAAEELAAGNFAVRVPQEDSGDGFDHLRRQMNLMAERIGALLKELQSVSSALAHDLRSPVARLTASIDTALASSEPGPALDALQLARSDAEVLEAMLATALELSRLESGAFPDRRKPLDLGEAVADLVELYEPLAEQSGVELSITTKPMTVSADRELLARALANLIDNALKYGGDRVSVEVADNGPWAEIRITDNGPGISEEDRGRATDRFTRLDNARTRPGAGLGLAVVVAVATRHGGTFTLSGRDDGTGGLVAVMRLPRA